MQGPASYQIVAQVVIAANGNFTGLFLYSPTPGLGNLIASIAAAPGTDPYTNPYLGGGFTSYKPGTNTLAELLAGSLLLQDSNSVDWTITAVPITALFGSPFIQIENVTDSTGLFINKDGSIVASDPTQPFGVPESFKAISLNAGFTTLAGFAAPEICLEPVGDGLTPGRVRLRGLVSLSANQAVGTAIATLPTQYQPAVSQYFLTGNSLAGGVGTQVESVRVISASGGGFLELGSNGNAGNYVLLEGITYVLD